jgi:FK506-binding protein-like
MNFYAPIAEWKNETKGLRKELISYKYANTLKASEVSKCVVEFSNLQNLESNESNYLKCRDIEITVELGAAITPVDCYIEIFLLEMRVGEQSRCSIRLQSGNEISFQVKLSHIEFGGYYYELSANQMLTISKKYKENGVKMFKNYPLFAQNYFNKAAKCLLSFVSMQDVEGRPESTNHVIPDKGILDDINVLLENVYLNISMCLIKQERFEEVIYILDYVNTQQQASDKAVYRKALAHLNLKQFENAKQTLEKTDYANNKELSALWSKLHVSWKAEDNKYADIVKKMFRS